MNNSSVVPTNNNNNSPAYMQTMETISKDQQTLDDIKLLTSEKVTDQLKVFLIAQARNELQRVVKLTRVLDRIEDNFIKRVDTDMTNDDLTLKQYSDIITIIVSLLSRSNEIISKVIKDDSLTTVFNTTIYQDGASNQTSIVSQLQDSHSRERVRIVVQQILERANQYTDQDKIIIEDGDKDEGTE